MNIFAAFDFDWDSELVLTIINGSNPSQTGTEFENTSNLLVCFCRNTFHSCVTLCFGK